MSNPISEYLERNRPNQGILNVALAGFVGVGLWSYVNVIDLHAKAEREQFEDKRLTQQRIAYAIVDKNNSGYLELDELLNLAEGLNISTEEIKYDELSNLVSKAPISKYKHFIELTSQKY